MTERKQQQVLAPGAPAGKYAPSEGLGGFSTLPAEQTHYVSCAFPELSSLFLYDWQTTTVTLDYNTVFFVTKEALLLKPGEIL